MPFGLWILLPILVLLVRPLNVIDYGVQVARWRKELREARADG